MTSGGSSGSQTRDAGFIRHACSDAGAGCLTLVPRSYCDGLECGGDTFYASCDDGYVQYCFWVIPSGACVSSTGDGATGDGAEGDDARSQAGVDASDAATEGSNDSSTNAVSDVSAPGDAREGGVTRRHLGARGKPSWTRRGAHGVHGRVVGDCLPMLTPLLPCPGCERYVRRRRRR